MKFQAESPREIIRIYAPTARCSRSPRFLEVKYEKLVEEYDERAKKLFVEVFKDTTNPAMAAYVRVLSKPGVRLFYGAPYSSG